ncbi:MFS transporter [Sporormia fimetaria CBS 119925]|uniref:MFS transporter n=1 Tax=Sporormia fimetaria CBS 119925 TaxID=1340428 RepID=A0A6A6VER5_9PLEO|nr:MFS transporter [Sporormia fimetaria CBS 119925]
MFSHLKVNAYNLWVVIFVGLGTISTAYGLAIIGSTVGQPNFYAYFNLAGAGEDDYEHTTNRIGALNGINSAGAIIGCVFNAWTSDKYSRKYSMMIGCVILILGGALCSGAVNMAMFLVGRFWAGMGAGMLACVVPMYQAEISTPETRGAMVCVTGVAYALGYSFASWLGYACWYMDGDSPHAEFAWRFPLAFQCVFPLMVLAGWKFIPFSPRWLLQQGRRTEALEVVKSLHASPQDVHHTKAREEFYLIEQQFLADKSIPIRRFELFRTPANRRRALVGFIMMWSHQFLGIFVLTNYGVLIYASLGLEGHLPLLLNACWTTFTIIGNIWTAFYIDRFGRRIFLLIGATGCTLCVIFLCALTAEFLNTDNIAGLRAAVFFIFFYIFWWCFFIDATQYVYIAEIFPNHLRPYGVALGISGFYLGSIICLVGAPVALNVIGWKFYLVLICPSVIYIVLIYLLFPETKGRTLEEIGSLFGDENIASHWYGVSEEEKRQLAQRAIAEIPESGDEADGTGREGKRLGEGGHAVKRV